MLEKKYGLWTTVSMVIGIVIGSGVFFKADNILMTSGGNVKIALLAWLVGAMSMIFGSLVFAECANRFEKSNGIVDYAEGMISEKFAYLIGWFNGIIYYPAIAAVLAWAAGNYTAILFNKDGNFVWIMASIYMIGIYILNYLSPILSGKFQVASTAIKLVPLMIIAIIGILQGLNNGILVENFSNASTVAGNGTGFAAAVLGAAFAYEGWVIATTINGEIKDAKKTLPKALVFGSLAIVIIYILYFLGIVGMMPTETIIKQGDNTVNVAARAIFGNFGASILTVFIIVSCLGTLNGLILGGSRSFYSLAIRDQGIKPELFSKLNSKTNIPTNSTIANFILICIYLFIWFANFKGLFPNKMFVDISELPIALIYGIYIVIYIAYMLKMKDLSYVKRFIIPFFALAGALIIVYGGLSKPSVIIDLGISVFVFISGLLFYNKRK
ncbi:APC family permease [Clostridium sporogenes]|uniref:APC family permease n=1 Tax=Clostridium botulinum TaxID=1491 RepID=A0A6M0SU11_CLOBO|nr:APC family permease [Clostridium sporogenes]NFA59009.1 APC family permease [Clostridium botulinum]NFI72962.1 APC family permease [Clostridium sporogenes]NFL71387.1 APC family permease [Clostridium sporogenes]NFM23003.1 APC family permease [Clostridium sporogenes]NFP60375.1 APC family permease [Clostridium sporogenes]